MNGQVEKCYNLTEIYSDKAFVGGIVGKAQGNDTLIEECYHIGDIESTTDRQAAGILGRNTFNPSVINCYSIGNVNGINCTSGVTGGGGAADCFNCYSIGKITASYCGGIINGMNYGGHIVNCFGRRGDFKTSLEGELTDSQKINSLSSYNNYNASYGHKDKTKIGYECDILTNDEMKMQSFVDKLNILIEAGKSGDNEGVITKTAQNVWTMDTEGINNGYPIFVWQQENNK